MTLRNRGEPAGFAKVGAPMVPRAMRHAMANDLERLSAILQRRARLTGFVPADHASRLWREVD